MPTRVMVPTLSRMTKVESSSKFLSTSRESLSSSTLPLPVMRYPTCMAVVLCSASELSSVTTWGCCMLPS